MHTDPWVIDMLNRNTKVKFHGPPMPGKPFFSIEYDGVWYTGIWQEDDLLFEEERDAIRKRGAASVDAQEQAEDGETVGKEDGQQEAT